MPNKPTKPIVKPTVNPMPNKPAKPVVRPTVNPMPNSVKNG